MVWRAATCANNQYVEIMGYKLLEVIPHDAIHRKHNNQSMTHERMCVSFNSPFRAGQCVQDESHFP